MKRKKYLNSTDFEDYFLKILNTDSSFKEEWENYQPEYEVMKAVLDARLSRNLSQSELATISGINQSEISKIESGTRNPSIKILRKIANAMDMHIEIKFVPNK